MKSNIKIISYAILFIHLLVIFAFANQSQNPVVRQKEAVTIVHNDGSKTKMTNFSYYLVHHTYSSRIYSDVPTSFKFSSKSIELQPIGYSAPFSIKIPFKIIKNIHFSLKDGDDWFSSSYFLATVTFGNGQIIKGRFFGNFEGETSFGKSTIEFETYNHAKASVKEIVFDHKPAIEYTEKPWGTNRIVLHITDGSVLKIGNAAFLKNIYNRNDVWIGEKPVYEMDFESNGVAMKVPWPKIDAISPIKIESSSDKSEEMLLTSIDGTEIRGRAIRGLTVKRIIGILAIGKAYKLQITISLMVNDPPHFLKIELK